MPERKAIQLSSPITDKNSTEELGSFFKGVGDGLSTTLPESKSENSKLRKRSTRRAKKKK